KDPSRRYQSASELGLDIRRFIASEPISARPIGRPARALRWIKRHKSISILSSSAILSLVLGTIISVYFAIAADAARRRSEETFQLLSASQQLSEQLKSSIAKLERDTTDRKPLTLSSALQAARKSVKVENLSTPRSTAQSDILYNPGDRIVLRS